MKRRIDDYIDILRKLYQCNVDKRKRWLELHLDDDFAFIICDCAKNILSGNLKINDVQKNRLRQYKQQLRTLINKRVGIFKEKRNHTIRRTRLCHPISNYFALWKDVGCKKKTK